MKSSAFKEVQGILRGTFTLPTNLLVGGMGKKNMNLSVVDTRTGKVLVSFEPTGTLISSAPVGEGHVFISIVETREEKLKVAFHLWNLASNSTRVLTGISEEMNNAQSFGSLVSLRGSNEDKSGRVILCDPFKNEQVASHNFLSPVSGISEPFEGSITALRLANETVIIYDWNSGLTLRRIAIPPSIPLTFRYTRFSKRGDTLLVMTGVETFFVNWKTGELLATWPYDDAFPLGGPRDDTFLVREKGMFFVLEGNERRGYTGTAGVSLGENLHRLVQLGPFSFVIQVNSFKGNARIQLVQVDPDSKEIQSRLLIRKSSFLTKPVPWNPFTLRVLRCVLTRRLQTKLPKDLIREVMGFF